MMVQNQETNVYERYVKDSINEAISNKQLEYLINANNGIFILNKDTILKEDLDVIEFKAKIIIDAKNGGLETHIKEFEILEKVNKVKKDKIPNVDLEIYPLKKDELIFDNSYGGFSKDGKEYYIYKNSENVLPAVWCNIICNNFFRYSNYR